MVFVCEGAVLSVSGLLNRKLEGRGGGAAWPLLDRKTQDERRKTQTICHCG